MQAKLYNAKYTQCIVDNKMQCKIGTMMYRVIIKIDRDRNKGK